MKDLLKNMDKYIGTVKLVLFSVVVVGLIILVTSLLVVGFQELFGAGGGCGYDLSC